MKTLRQLGVYTLLKNTESENKSLVYYIDNGEDVTEYFDVLDKNYLLSLSDKEFLNACTEYF